MAAETAEVVRFRRKLEWKREYWWYAPFAGQLIAFLVFSTWEYNRFALTNDFAIYWQGVWLIAHGHLDPLITVSGVVPFLHNHFELIMWPVALLYWIWPHASLLLYVQDLVLVAAEWVAWQWLRSVIRDTPQLPATWVSGTAIVMWLGSPALYWTVAFDFHSECFTALTVVGALYALWRRNTRALALWVGITLLCGNVGGLALSGVGVSALLLRRWRIGVIVSVVALGWLALLQHLGINIGASFVTSSAPAVGHATNHAPALSGFAGLVVGVLSHPGVLAHQFLRRWRNWYAAVGPSGIVSAVSPWSFGTLLATLAPATLASYRMFSDPGFQNVALVPVAPVGTILLLSAIARRWTVPTTAWRIVLGAFALNAIGWGAAWLPQWPTQWVRVSQPAAHTLRTVESIIPRSAAVIAPQGLIGRFAGRPIAIEWRGTPDVQQAGGRPTYIVAAPYQGIHVSSITQQASMLEDLAYSRRATLVYEHHGVYLWRIYGAAPLPLPIKTTLPAWAFGSQTGKRVVGSPPKDWYVAGLGQNGNVLDQAYWYEPVGHYRVSVVLSSQGPSQVQVWDATTDRLITEFSVTQTRGSKVAWSRVLDYTTRGASRAFDGWGPWIDLALPSPIQNELEVRVNAPASSMVNVYSVGLTPVH